MTVASSPSVLENDLVTVANFPNMLEASLAKSALEAAGIPAFVPGEGRWELDVDLKVLASDRDRAIDLLKTSGRQ